MDGSACTSRSHLSIRVWSESRGFSWSGQQFQVPISFGDHTALSPDTWFYARVADIHGTTISSQVATKTLEDLAGTGHEGPTQRSLPNIESANFDYNPNQEKACRFTGDIPFRGNTWESPMLKPGPALPF